MQAVCKDVNVDRIVERIEQLATYSTTERGVTRLPFTKESEKVNTLVSQWMEEAGMVVRRDELNNVIGRYEGNGSSKRSLIIGSHLDSVVEAGKYDGILGVISGIEVVQTIHESGVTPRHPIEVVAFCDEEGARFHTTLIGSRAMAGTLSSDDLLAKDANGVTIAEALENVGIDSTKYHKAARDPDTILGYLELHIEQGPVLEQMNQSCGAVSGIAGATRFQFQVEGLASHAGTVPMTMRQDALMATSEMLQALEQIANQYEALVATVGSLSVSPGASNVIPGLVAGTIDIRCIDDERKQKAIHQIEQHWKSISDRRRVALKLEKVMEAPATYCSQEFTDMIKSVLVDHQMEPVEIVSGAGHDAMAVAAITDIGMIFVRCKGGLSHHPDEEASAYDMKQGTAVLLDVVLKITS